MLTYDLQNMQGPLYESIYRCLKNDIMNGILQPGEHLPSKRSFAQNHGISTITIQNAYDQLISEGYVYTIPKRGYFVADISKLQRVPKVKAISLDLVLPEEKPAYEVNLSDHQMNPDHFPFSIWAKLLRETISTRKEALMQPSPTGGIWELRQAIAEHLKSFRGMLVDPDQIVVGAGTEYLYTLLIQLLGSDRIFCVENPGYKKLTQIYQEHQVHWCCADLDTEGLMISGLEESGADIAHISPNHHFPTGICMPASRRYELLAWANEQEGRYIIEDDYDSEFRHNGKPIPPLFSLDACEKVIYMNTFSKSLASTVRISYMVLPAHLANRFYRQLSFYACTVSNFEQYTLAEFIAQGYFEKHINRMRLFYSRKRKEILSCIKHSDGGRFVRVMENSSGLHFLMELDWEGSIYELKKLLLEQGIYVNGMWEYYLREPEQEDKRFILNYANISTEQLSRAMNVLKTICESEKQEQ